MVLYQWLQVIEGRANGSKERENRLGSKLQTEKQKIALVINWVKVLQVRNHPYTVGNSLTLHFILTKKNYYHKIFEFLPPLTHSIMKLGSLYRKLFIAHERSSLLLPAFVKFHYLHPQSTNTHHTTFPQNCTELKPWNFNAYIVL